MTVLTLLVALVAAGAATDPGQSLKAGKAGLASAGPLAFGPDGILFVGDSAGATLWAIDTGDRTPGTGSINVSGLQDKVAAMLGTTPDQVAINDMIVNPISRKAYLSVSRGRGPDAAAVILRLDATGKIEDLRLDNVKHAKVSLANAPAADAKDRRGNSLRTESITDVHYVDGKVFLAGLSNEEFASKLRSVPFPFTAADDGTSVEIYHGAHGAWETRSPVRTFVPYEIKKESHILAAYTCTPLVKFPVKELKPGSKLVGTTIAELGNRNRPLDMIVYKKDGGEFVLMSNSSRGVMKMSTKGIEGHEAITTPVEDKKGLPYETVADWKGVEQLDKLDDGNALVLTRAEGGALDLKTLALP
ncbi:MAG TPA: hypothetical protein VI669_19680 [Vicinamibacteria bacterium]